MTAVQESSFLALVSESCDRRRREVLDAARAEARATLRAARTQAAARVRQALKLNRARQREELARVRAELATRLRLVVQSTEQRWLDLAWPRLGEELARRWQSPPARKRWIEAALARAEQVLAPDASFRIEHPAALDPDEVARAVTAARAFELVPTPEIETGLRVIAAGAVLDATAAGLLSRKSEIQGRLLASLHGGLG